MPDNKIYNQILSFPITYLDLIYFVILLVLLFLYNKKDSYITWVLLLLYFISYYVLYLLELVGKWPFILGAIIVLTAFYTITKEQTIKVNELIVSFFAVICFFVIYHYVDSVYINIGTIILLSITMYVLRTKQREINLVILFSVLMVLLLIKNLFDKYYVKEKFYTLFEPHYLDRKLYYTTPKDALLSYNNNNYYTKPISLSYVNNDNEYLANFLGKLIISRTKMLNLNLNKNSNVKDLIIMPNRDVGKYNNIKFIGNLSHRYLYCISSIKSGIQFIQQLKEKRLGIPEYLLPIWNDIEPYIFDKKLTIVVKSKEELAKDLKNHKIDAIFYCDRHGNQYINDIINSTVTASFQLVPIVFNYGNQFLDNNKAYRKTILKLTNEYMPSKYLPMGYGRIWNSNYMPDYWTYSYDISLYSSDSFPEKFGYQLAKILVTARQLITRKNTQNINDYIYDTMTPADVAILIFPNMQIQDGARKYYNELGLISYCKNPACVLKIGKGRCTECDEIKLLTTKSCY